MKAIRNTLLLVSLLALVLPEHDGFRASEATESRPLMLNSKVERSPVDLAIVASGKWLVTANETSNSVSLIRAEDRRVVDELAIGSHPASIIDCGDQRHVLASCTYSGDVCLLSIEGDRLQLEKRIHVGMEPVGLAMHPESNRAYVGLTASAEVAELNLDSGTVERRIAVGQWPRYLALSPDGTRLSVASSGESKIFVIDTSRGEVLYDEALSGGINIGHVQSSADGKYAYFPWMIYRTNPINPNNIRRGWVLASRIGRVRLDGSAYREAISLDVPRLAIADPHGLAISPNEHRLVVSASGTHELLVYRLNDLPFIGVGGPGDLIDQRLLKDQDLFYRIELGGRPMGLKYSADNTTVWVANYFRNSVQVVDIEQRKLIDEISLGESPEPSLARRGMEVFYDGRRSLDQWYSCHSCHYQGGVNSKAMDTSNDGSENTLKTVLPLAGVHKTSPWTWHGWQTDLEAAMQKSFTSTMQGKALSANEMREVLAYLKTIDSPPNPYREPDGSLSAAAARGQAVFNSRKAGCANCHSGPLFTDGQIHDVGLGSKEDRYDGFNTPSLKGTYRKVRWLHDGRTKSLEELLAGPHAPESVTREGKLSSDEIQDLVAYLKSQ